MNEKKQIPQRESDSLLLKGLQSISMSMGFLLIAFCVAGLSVGMFNIEHMAHIIIGLISFLSMFFWGVTGKRTILPVFLSSFSVFLFFCFVF